MFDSGEFENYRIKYPMLKEVRISLQRLSIPEIKIIIEKLKSTPKLLIVEDELEDNCNNACLASDCLQIKLEVKEEEQIDTLKNTSSSIGSIKHEIPEDENEENFILPHSNYQCTNCIEEFPNELTFMEHLEHCDLAINPQTSQGQEEKNPNQPAALLTSNYTYRTDTGIISSQFNSLLHSIVEKPTERLEENSNEQFSQYDQYASIIACPVCNFIFPKDETSLLEEHMEIHEKINCEICDENFEDIEDFKWHWKKSPNCREFKNGYVCEICGERFPRLGAIKKHWLLHEEKICCEICKCEFSFSIFKLHIETHRVKNLINCNFCHNTFSTQENLENHLTTHTKDKPFNCWFCTEGFAKKITLEHHMRKHTEIKCEFCTEIFTKKSLLNEHIKVHKEGRMFKCFVCDKSFHLSRNFKKHNIKVHSQDPSSKCEICGKICSREDHLKIHMQTHMSGEKFKCRLCPRTFVDAKELKVHADLNHKEKKNFKCEVCGKIFKLAGFLKNHQRLRKECNMTEIKKNFSHKITVKSQIVPIKKKVGRKRRRKQQLIANTFEFTSTAVKKAIERKVRANRLSSSTTTKVVQNESNEDIEVAQVAQINLNNYVDLENDIMILEEGSVLNQQKERMDFQTPAETFASDVPTLTKLPLRTMYKCSICGLQFPETQNVIDHLANVHSFFVVM